MTCLFLRVSSDLAWSFHDVVLACSSFLGGQAGKETHPFFRALLGGGRFSRSVGRTLRGVDVSRYSKGL